MNNLVQAYHDYLSGKSLKDLSLILSDEEFGQLKQMIHNNEYWGDRLANATHQALNQGMTESEQMFKLYDDLANKLSNELLQLYSKIDAQKALGDVHISDFYRSGQLQNILDTIRKECQKMGQYENKTMNKLLPDAVNKGYEIAGDTFDIHLGHLNKKAVESVVSDKWTEKSFSDRIWDNKAKLIDQLNDKLLTGLSTGQSPYKIATELSKSLNVGKNVAQRLAITEYMNKLNMGQKKAYEEAGYDEVRWHAVEDERKCAVCGKLHDTKFKLNEAPHAPIHPRCRCILLPVIDEVEDKGEPIKESGALWKDFENATDMKTQERLLHKMNQVAEQYYQGMRNSKKSLIIKSITKSFKDFTRQSERESIQKVSNAFQHAVLNKYLLYDVATQSVKEKHFAADYDMMQSFQRLRLGKPLEHDIIMIEHENMEYLLMKDNPGMSYREAHKITEKVFDYNKSLNEWKAKENE